MSSPQKKNPWYRILYVQVLIAVALGIALGHYYPELGKSLKPLGDGFIKLVKMIIAPIIFCTIVHGISSIQDIKKLGRVGMKAIVYFELVSTLALAIGLVVVNVLRPGDGFNIDPTLLDPKISENYAAQAHSRGLADFLLNIIPNTFFDAFSGGDLLHILLVSILTGFAVAGLGEQGKPVLAAVDYGSKIFFGIMAIIVKVAPIGAFGAMAFTVGAYGIVSLQNLLELIAGFYLAAGIFVVVVMVLGTIARAAGFSIFRLLIYIKEEIFLVLGTSSSETALPSIIAKMKRLGCAESTVGLVIPTGYSFNLDGTNIYMTMAAVFLAQATNTHLDLMQQLSLLAVAMLSSKGASGVTGAGFVTLAATLAVVPSIPIQSLAILVGIDRFMSECRAITNLIGNSVATVVVSRWEKEVSAETIREGLRREVSLGENM
ncbi:dicarboxylate/amino acid:cation symporter [soil metagenome]